MILHFTLKTSGTSLGIAGPKTDFRDRASDSRWGRHSPLTDSFRPEERVQIPPAPEPESSSDEAQPWKPTQRQADSNQFQSSCPDDLRLIAYAFHTEPAWDYNLSSIIPPKP